MSPNIITVDGYRFVIYNNDHRPAHVHVIKGERAARVHLATSELTENYGFTPAEVRRILKLSREHHAALMDAWRRLHPED